MGQGRWRALHLVTPTTHQPPQQPGSQRLGECQRWPEGQRRPTSRLGTCSRRLPPQCLLLQWSPLRQAAWPRARRGGQRGGFRARRAWLLQRCRQLPCVGRAWPPPLQPPRPACYGSSCCRPTRPPVRRLVASFRGACAQVPGQRLRLWQQARAALPEMPPAAPTAERCRHLMPQRRLATGFRLPGRRRRRRRRRRQASSLGGARHGPRPARVRWTAFGRLRRRTGSGAVQGGVPPRRGLAGWRGLWWPAGRSSCTGLRRRRSPLPLPPRPRTRRIRRERRCLPRRWKRPKPPPWPTNRMGWE
mmetsp:Transcript_18930/g.72227  ORF Transcript_18930/g.72227 Transcript_18930/m.72227 type:complete len:303 (+) Transcript_18930:690-1598(+)